MTKSILLEQRNRALSILMAIIFVVNGTLNITDNQISTFRFSLGILMLILGMYFSFHAIFGYSVKSKWAAKMRITDTLIELRNKFWINGATIKLTWQDIQGIHLTNEKIEFLLPTETKSISYHTSAEQHYELKQLLKQSAEQHNIQFVDVDG